MYVHNSVRVLPTGPQDKLKTLFIIIQLIAQTVVIFRLRFKILK